MKDKGNEREKELLALIQDQYNDLRYGNFQQPQRNCISLFKKVKGYSDDGTFTLLDLLDQEGRKYDE